MSQTLNVQGPSMLPDPLSFSADSANANLIPYQTTDIAPGKSTRQSVSDGAFAGRKKCVLNISHTVSKENAPLGSDRTLIRLDQNYVGEDGVGNPVLTKDAVATVQLVIVRPKDGFITTAQVAAMVKGFVAGLFASGTEATHDTIKAALSSTYLERVLDGEP